MIRNLALAAASLLVYLLGAEIFCRIVKPDERWFADPYDKENPLFHMLTYDPVLGWRGRRLFQVVNIPEWTNSRGLRGPEFPDRKPAGVFRIAVLGDSTTWNCQFNDVNRALPLIEFDDPYPAMLGALLAPYNRPGRRYEVINGGMLGYSTLQGLRFLRRDVLKWEPDVVLIRFGWNDHWGREPGYRLHPEPRNPLLRRMYWTLLQSRLYTFLVRLITTAMPAFQGASEDATPALVHGAPRPENFRVPPEEYVYNLRLMIREARAHGALPVLLDSPYGIANPAFTRSKSLKPFLGAMGYGNLEAVFRVHRRYNALTAKVAREEGVPFIGLDAVFAEHGRANFFGPTETIHPNHAGNWLIARTIVDKLRELKIIDAPRAKGLRPGARSGSQPAPERAA